MKSLNGTDIEIRINDLKNHCQENGLALGEVFCGYEAIMTYLNRPVKRLAYYQRRKKKYQFNEYY